MFGLAPRFNRTRTFSSLPHDELIINAVSPLSSCGVARAFALNGLIYNILDLDADLALGPSNRLENAHDLLFSLACLLWVRRV